MILTAEEMALVQAQAEAEYPAECCGVLLIQGSAPGDRLLVPCRNIQDDLLAIGRREAQGYAVAVIYHSHIDAGAYFSPTDKRNALINGEPAYPHALYVVLSVMAGTVADARA